MHAQSYRNTGIYFCDAIKYLEHFLCMFFFFNFLFNPFSWEKLDVGCSGFLGFFLVRVCFQVFLKDDLLMKVFGIL